MANIMYVSFHNIRKVSVSFPIHVFSRRAEFARMFKKETLVKWMLSKGYIHYTVVAKCKKIGSKNII